MKSTYDFKFLNKKKKKATIGSRVSVRARTQWPSGRAEIPGARRGGTTGISAFGGAPTPTS